MGNVCIVVNRCFYHIANTRRCLFIITGACGTGFCSWVAASRIIVDRIDSLTKQFARINGFSIILSSILNRARTGKTNYQYAYCCGNDSCDGLAVFAGNVTTPA